MYKTFSYHCLTFYSDSQRSWALNIGGYRKQTIEHVSESLDWKEVWVIYETSVAGYFYRIPPALLLYRITDAEGKVPDHWEDIMVYLPMIYNPGYCINPYFTITFGLCPLFLFIKFCSVAVLHVLKLLCFVLFVNAALSQFGVKASAS